MRYLRKSSAPKLRGISKPCVVVDKQEKKPFDMKRVGFPCESGHLKIGDYSFVGKENIIAIEKKDGWEEFIVDISGRYNEWFIRQCTKLASCKRKIMVIDAPLDDLPIVLAKSRSKVNLQAVLAMLCRIQTRWQIPVVFLPHDRELREYYLYCIFRAMWRGY